MFDATEMQGVRTFADSSDAYANGGRFVSFEHVSSGQEVSFKAFVTAFNETYSPDWSSESVYGRADPIHVFKNTSRRITLSLMLPASTIGEGYQNLGRVQKLVQFLYPTYENIQNANTISQSPLVRLKIMNLIANRENTGSNTVSGKFKSIMAPTSGVLTAIRSFTVNHHLENPDAGVFEVASDIIIPKLIEINTEFDVIHEHGVGWQKKADTRQTSFDVPLFPYGIDLVDAKLSTTPTVIEQFGLNSPDNEQGVTQKEADLHNLMHRAGMGPQQLHDGDDTAGEEDTPNS